MSDEKRACKIPVRHNKLSDGDVEAWSRPFMADGWTLSGMNFICFTFDFRTKGAKASGFDRLPSPPPPTPPQLHPHQARYQRTTSHPSHHPLRPRSSIRRCPTTVGQYIPLPLVREQTNFGFTVRQRLASDEKSADKIPIRHNALSDGDVKVCLSYDTD